MLARCWSVSFFLAASAAIFSAAARFFAAAEAVEGALMGNKHKDAIELFIYYCILYFWYLMYTFNLSLY